MSSTRGRDRLGRPLPADADPSLVVASVPLRDDITDDEAWREACDYLDRDLPFHAHETFELRWRIAPEQDRAAWRALAQWGAALTHEARGNVIGSRRIAARALDTLADAPHVPDVVELDTVVASLTRLANGA
jgi:predicted metal-dependent hydrolase